MQRKPIPFSKQYIEQLHQQIDTPALIIKSESFERNINQMQSIASENNAKLRPHIKTHKSVDIAKMQMAAGAVGIAVAKMGEAEVMAEAGISDIFVANQITHPIKIERLKELHPRINIIIGIDHPQQIDLLADKFSADYPLPVRIEIDSGLKRCGVEIGADLLSLAKKIKSTPGLVLDGIFTHAGQVYGVAEKSELQTLGEHEGAIARQAIQQLKSIGVTGLTVSVGSTPTIAHSVKNPAVTEARPGNYVFYDGIQLALQSCEPDQCSLFILATIISQPAPDRIVIDAGSKALNLDKGAHAKPILSGFGTPLNIDGTIVRLSEEHGIIQLENEREYRLGEPVLILPNHACAVANLYEKYYLINEKLDIRELAVSARGKSQ